MMMLPQISYLSLKMKSDYLAGCLSLRSSSMIRMELITLSAVESFLTLDNVFMLVMIELRIDKYKDNLFTISIYK